MCKCFGKKYQRALLYMRNLDPECADDGSFHIDVASHQSYEVFIFVTRNRTSTPVSPPFYSQ
jgi:hypothetical protein